MKSGNNDIQLKKRWYSLDDKFALFVYIILLIYFVCCGAHYYRALVHTNILYYTYMSTLFVNLVTVGLALVFRVTNKLRAEIAFVSFFLMASLGLFLANVWIYFTFRISHYFSDCVIYIFATSIQSIFSVYRMLKIKEMLRFYDEATEIFKRHDEHRAGRGDL